MNISKISAALGQRIKGFDTREVRVGWFEGVNYPNGTSVATVATIQEYGSPSQNIPPRPFLRPAIDGNRDKWIKTLISGAKAAGKGSISADNVLDAVGLQVVGDIKQSIQSVTSPALSQSTINARAAKYASGEVTSSLTKPLIDTGLMISSTNHLVADKS